MKEKIVRPTPAAVLRWVDSFPSPMSKSVEVEVSDKAIRLYMLVTAFGNEFTAEEYLLLADGEDFNKEMRA